ncbi:hypothetical protein [Actinomyces trachealis]|uniref:hypothetical protein n=1 Tax=Actinomyces trachealis TaxID=2763540 RepID=UPI001892BCD9|nr:hypothetical protein [Actinomyces trachealis]
MASVLIPVFLLLGLSFLVVLLAEYRSPRTWGQWAKEIADIIRKHDEEEEPVHVVFSEARLSDLMVRDSTPAYMGTDSFKALVDVIDCVIDNAETAKSYRWSPVLSRSQTKTADAR